MKKLFKGLFLMMAMVVMMAMPVSASTQRDPVISPEFPEDEHLNDSEDERTEGTDLPEDEYKGLLDEEGDGDSNDGSRSPKTSDNSLTLYVMAMTAIAAAGTVLIAKKKEA